MAKRSRKPGVVIPSFRRSSQVAAERRLSVAMAASIALHVVALVAFGPALLRVDRTSPFGQGALALQAVLVQADSQPEVEQPLLASSEPEDAPKVSEPAQAPDVLPPTPQGPETVAPAAGPAAMGSRDPPVSITVGAVIDPTRFGARYAKTLAELFPDPVARPPQLRSSLVLMYPREAMETRTKARIAAILTIDELGAIAAQTLVPEDATFGPVVADALRTAQFLPAEWDGKPVRYWTILEFVFWVDGARREVGVKQVPVAAPATARRPPPPPPPKPAR